MDRREAVRTLGNALITASGIYLFGNAADIYAQQRGQQSRDSSGNGERRYNGSHLLTRPTYNDDFSSIPNADTQVASVIYPMDLQTAVNSGVIPPNATDLLMPLGISGRGQQVDFYRGMRMMWDAKRQPRGREERESLRERRNHFLRSMRKRRTYSSLLDYRSQEITHGTNLFEEINDGMRSSWDVDTQAFMGEVVGVLKPNAFLGYNIQELLPPYIGGRRINPVAKAWFLDRLFSEAGKELIEGYPARYDRRMSHGPFQMTNLPMPQIVTRNQYVAPEDRVPQHVQNFEGLQQHVNAAAMLAHVNWRGMARYLKGKPSSRRRNANLLQEFRRAFDHLDTKEKQIVVAGLTACMHNLPGGEYYSRRRKRWVVVGGAIPSTANYLDRGNIDTMHYGIKGLLNAQLRKYYDSAAEAYLLMKVFDILEERYGRD